MILSRRLVLIALVISAASESAMALISGSSGNDPLHDPGWPAGAAAIFNHPCRIAWWEGPPFGGGQWCAEYRGDAQSLNSLLAEVAKIDAKVKRLVLRDGVGGSFWLNPNREPEKRTAARMDWNFTVWQPASWKRQLSFAADMRPPNLGDPQLGPPIVMEVYRGGDLRWQDIAVPPGIEIDDRRLAAHGYSAEDGTVLEGKVVDAQNQQPLAAKIQLTYIEPKPKGGYKYSNTREIICDADGQWLLINTPPGWFRLVASADGYVPRVIGHLRADDQPRWYEFNGELSKPAPVTGQVLDADGKPLADVRVRLHSVIATDDTRYDSINDYETKTAADGRFRIDTAPIGKARITLFKEGLVRPGLGKQIEMPATDLSLSMSTAASLLVNVQFGDAEKPPHYMIDIEPTGGNKTGSWGGSSLVDDEHRAMFRNVPPGEYIVRGHPNPTTEAKVTDPVQVELSGGEAKTIELRAK